MEIFHSYVELPEGAFCETRKPTALDPWISMVSMVSSNSLRKIGSMGRLDLGGKWDWNPSPFLMANDGYI